MRVTLAAALPVLNTARATCDEPMPVEGDAEEAQTCDHPAIPGTDRCPIHDPAHQRYIDGLNDEIRHLRQSHASRDSETADVIERMSTEFRTVLHKDPAYTHGSLAWRLMNDIDNYAASLRGKQ
jgi:hypothetical protein